ncbi:unnamed protein product [Toxocara canis]|uniref:MacB_PCD domain-containing protein n=1 Tax=Toxocara canis TaxID=6265 RepID=A0A183V1A8_TOXCA|nr:unnamed protein product [Toxocara canis]
MAGVMVLSEQICHSPPQKYTNTGTFVVDLSTFANRHEIALDGLGASGKPQGSSRYYKFMGAIAVKVQGLDGADVKALGNRYEHPGTRIERGRFMHKIMTGVNSSSGSPLPLAVVIYEWFGVPHPIQLKNMIPWRHLDDRTVREVGRRVMWTHHETTG